MTAQAGWESTQPPLAGSGPRADPDRNPARVLSAIALASMAAGAINLAAAATIGSSNAQYLAFFTVVGVAQLAWRRSPWPGLPGGGWRSAPQAT